MVPKQLPLAAIAPHRAESLAALERARAQLG